MQFDGVERYKQMRKERNLGALRREGFQPARRHPSASRRRSKEAPEFGSDDAFLGGCELRPQDSGDLALRVYHNIPCSAAQLAPQQRGGSGRVSPPRRHVNLASDGDAARYQRSLSAPPIRSIQSGTRMSCDLKMTRASNVAISLSKMGQAASVDPLQRPEVKELYAWLKAISLHEYLPSLLEMGVEEVGHIGDVEVADLEEAGMARPERKRFLRAQSQLLLAPPASSSGRSTMCIRSAAAEAHAARRGSEFDTEFDTEWLSPGGARSREGSVSERSGCSADASTLLQVSTGSPDAGSPGDASLLSPLIDCTKLMSRSKAICSFRLAGQAPGGRDVPDSSNRTENSASPGSVSNCGFLASFGALGSLIVTTCGAVPSIEVAARGMAVFGVDDGEGSKVCFLDPEAFWWTDEAIGLSVIGCTGHQGAVDGMPIKDGTTCAPDDDLHVIHPSGGCQLSVHRAVAAPSIDGMAAEEHSIFFSCSPATSPAVGLPVFHGGRVSAVNLGPTDNESLCKAVTMQTILNAIRPAMPVVGEIQSKSIRMTSAPSSGRGGSPKGARSGIPPRHTLDVATSPMSSGGKGSAAADNTAVNLERTALAQEAGKENSSSNGSGDSGSGSGDSGSGDSGSGSGVMSAIVTSTSVSSGVMSACGKHTLSVHVPLAARMASLSADPSHVTQCSKSERSLGIVPSLPLKRASSHSAPSSKSSSSSAFTKALARVAKVVSRGSSPASMRVHGQGSVAALSPPRLQASAALGRSQNASASPPGVEPASASTPGAAAASATVTISATTTSEGIRHVESIPCTPPVASLPPSLPSPSLPSTLVQPPANPPSPGLITSEPQRLDAPASVKRVVCSPAAVPSVSLPIMTPGSRQGECDGSMDGQDVPTPDTCKSTCATSKRSREERAEGNRIEPPRFPEGRSLEGEFGDSRGCEEEASAGDAVNRSPGDAVSTERTLDGLEEEEEEEEEEEKDVEAEAEVQDQEREEGRRMWRRRGSVEEEVGEEEEEEEEVVSFVDDASSSAQSTPQTPQKEKESSRPRNPLEEKLLEASPQVLVHILAHCPEQHILVLTLKRSTALLADCCCNGPCLCPHRLEFESVGGVPAVMDVARRFRDCAEIQSEALSSLGSLALCSTVQRVISVEGGVQVALGAMDAHPMSAEVCCPACKLLCNLAFEDEPVQLEVCVSGGVERVVKAMSLNGDIEAIQAEGCGVLCNLAASDSTWDHVFDGGAVSAVIEAMGNHVGSSGVQFKGCCALCSMTGAAGQRYEVVSLGGVTAIVRAMREHRGSTEVLYKGCSALLNLAEQADQAHAVVKSGGVSALVGTLGVSGDDVQLACKALRAVKELGMHKKAFGVMVRHGASTVQAVVAVMARHTNDEEVLIRSCAVIALLSRDTASLGSIVEGGAIGLICSAVQSLSHSESLLVEACGALSVLAALHADALSLIAASNVIASTRVACKGLHSDSDAVKSAASRLERSLLPRGGAFQLEGQAPDTRESLTRRLLFQLQPAKGDRRPISATLAVSRGTSSGSRPSTAVSSSRGGKGGGSRRPASASFAVHKAGMTGGTLGLAGLSGSMERDEVRGSLMIQHQILTLKKEAESLRRENLAIMAGAVAEMEAKPELDGVSVEATIGTWSAASDVPRDSLSHHSAASGVGAGRKAVRSSSAKRIRSSSPYLQNVKPR